MSEINIHDYSIMHDILVTQLHADSKQSYYPSIEIKQTIIVN